MALLTEKAVITALHLNMWLGRKRDSRAVTMVADASGSEKDMHIYSKMLLPRGSLDPIQRCQRQAHYAWVRASKPWLEQAQRITPKTRYLALAEVVSEKRSEMQSAVEALISNLPKMKREAKQRLGTLYSDADYPTADEIRSSFDIKLLAYPIPIANDWRVELEGEEAGRAKADLEKALKDAEADYVYSVWEGLFGAMDRVSKQLDKATFRKQSMEALRDVLQEVTDFNVLGDPKLEKIRQRIEKSIASVSVEEINTDDKVRGKVTKDVATIMKDMSAYMGG